jgi:hypothetical protein
MVNLPIEYSDKPVTPFGGMALMKRFIDQTGIREHLATLDLPQGGSNRAYDAVQIIESFWLGIWTGASRFLAMRACRAKAPTAGSLASSPRHATQRCSRPCRGGFSRRSTWAR